MKSSIRNKIIDRTLHGTYIVFEIGPTHTGLESALKLIDIAKKNGADAVKFQYLYADRLMADKSIKFSYSYLEIENDGSEKFIPVSEPLYDILKRRELSKDEWIKVRKYCDELDIPFISTATFDDEVDFLVDVLKVDSIKLASADIANIPFIKYCAQKCALYNLNFQMDTGNADLWEIERAVIAAEEMNSENIIIHHCPTGYPARLQSINLNTIKTLKHLFPKYAIAFSDHTQGWDMDVAAIALGVDMVEKTITLNRTIKSCEHSFSLEPQMAENFIKTIKDVDVALGSTRRIIPQAEKTKRKGARRSPYAMIDMKVGDLIIEDKFEYKRPESGISVMEFTSFIGKKLLKSIYKGQVLGKEYV